MANRNFYPKFRRPSQGQGGIYDEQQQGAANPEAKTVYDADGGDTSPGSSSYNEPENTSEPLDSDQLRDAEERGDDNAQESGKKDADKSDKSGDSGGDNKDDGGDNGDGGSGKGSKGDDAMPWKPVKFQSSAKRKRKKLLIGGGILAAMLGGGAGLVLLFFPSLAVKHIMNTIKSGLNDRIEYAVERRAEKFVEKYMKNVITPSLRECGTMISKDCVAVNPGTGIMGRMFTNWRDNRIEEKLFNNYGLEFKRNLRDPNTILVYHKGELIGDSGLRSTTKEVLKFTDQLTVAPSIRERWQVRSLLWRKYQASKWCWLACKKRDAVADLKISAIRKLKLKIIAWISQPIGERKATYLMCFVLDCRGEVDKLANEAAERIIKNVDGDALAKIAAEVGDKSLGQFLTEKAVQTIVTKIAGPVAGEAAASSVPIAGQIYLAATLADMVDRIDTAIANKEMTQYVRGINESAYANYFAAWATIDDDIQSGDASAEDISGALELVDGFDRSRIYQKMTGSRALGAVSCDDNVVINGQDGPLACPEKHVQPVIFIEEWRNTDEGKVIARLINTYGACYGTEVRGNCVGIRPRTVIRPILEGINYILGGVSNLLIGSLSYIPGLGDFMNSVTEIVSNNAFKLLNYLMTKMFPEVVNGDAEDQEAFDQIVAGADVTYNAFAKGQKTDEGFIGLGAARVNDEQQAALDSAIAQQKADEWNSSSLFARYLDLGNPRSVASQSVTNIAISIPKLKRFEINLNVFSALGNVIRNITTPQVSAAVLTDRGEMFGVTQYAFPVDDPALEIESELLTDEVCAQYEAAREASKIIDPDTREEIYTVTNPCALDQTVADSMTKVFSLDPAGGQ
ncbi:MAG: hypothetical protein KIH63_001935 [Candidatus Saccharibacteria bacterium]|nr:hypothetical protein [Candidatus Saccharibacteria bacterium]